MTRTTRTLLIVVPLIAVSVAIAAATRNAAAPGNAPGSDAANANATIETQSRAYLHSYNLPSSGVALEGYCPVAYFEANKPIRGKAQFASTYNDVTYYFVSDGARELFEANPHKYIPAYGGWCAFGIALKEKFPVDPTNFKIVDGRLMLFLRNQGVDTLAMWNDGNESDLIAKADAHWKKVTQ